MKYLVNLTLTDCSFPDPSTFDEANFTQSLAAFLNITIDDVHEVTLGVDYPNTDNTDLRAYVHLTPENVINHLAPMSSLDSLEELAPSLGVTCYGPSRQTMIATTFPAPSPPPPSPPPPSPPPSPPPPSPPPAPPPSPPPTPPPPFAPPPASPPAGGGSYCYYKCYTSNTLEKTVHLFSSEVDFFSSGTCSLSAPAAAGGTWYCGATGCSSTGRCVYTAP